MSEQHGDWNQLFVVPSKDSTRSLSTAMSIGSSDESVEPPAAAVLRSLNDDDCRTILTALNNRKSANTLREVCDLPRSTVYRKLELLREAELVREYTEVRSDGPNTTLYKRDFTDISIGIDDSDEFTIDIDRPEERAEDRLATFWTEMKDESS